MAKRQRYLLFALVTGLILFLGLVLWQYLLAGVIQPVATVIWLLLRIFILSVDQQIYWWALIILVGLVAFARLFRGSGPIEPYQLPDGNTTLDRVRHWQASILLNTHGSRERDYLRQDLRRLLATLYAAGRQGSANFEIETVLKQHQIPLPEPVYAFLYPEEPLAPRQGFFKHPVVSITQMLRSARLAPRTWLRRWTGREAAEYYQAIGQVLTLLETSLEMKDDGDPIEIGNH